MNLIKLNLKRLWKVNVFSKFIIILFLFITIKLYSKKNKIISSISDKNHIIEPTDIYINNNIHIKNDYKLFEYYKNIDIYKYLKFPLISVILIISNDSIEDKIQTFLNDLDRLKKKDNIEVIISFPKNNIKVNNTINEYTNINKELKMIQEEVNETILYDQLIHIINKCKGRFLILIKEYHILDENLVDDIFNYTNGKIDNIYEYFVEKDNKSYYIMKTKILRDIFDNGIIFESFDELINLMYSLKKPILNYISISFCIDNNYLLNTYAALLSILDNKNYFTYISFYILISKDFTNENINIISSLYEQYDFFNITFLRMDNRFDKIKTFRYITKSTYFKLALGDYLKNLNKTIYLDSDVIVFKDLTNLYQHNFNGYLMLAIPTVFIGNKLIKKDIYYNAGVLLLNLKKMREIEFNKKVIEILKSGFKDTFNEWNDQAIVNKFFYDYIGFLELEYNSKLGLFDSNSKYYLKKKDYFNLINVIHSEKYPAIYHFTGKDKPYIYKRKKSDDWWFFAKKGKYFKKFFEKRNT